MIVLQYFIKFMNTIRILMGIFFTKYCGWELLMLQKCFAAMILEIGTLLMLQKWVGCSMTWLLLIKILVVGISI